MLVWNNLASKHDGNPTNSHPEVDGKLVWLGHQILLIDLIATKSEDCPQEQPRSGITRGLIY